MRYLIFFVVVLEVMLSGCPADIGCKEEGDTQCNETDLQICEGGQWKTKETCAVSGGQCVERNENARCENTDTDGIEDVDSEQDSQAEENSEDELEPVCEDSDGDQHSGFGEGCDPESADFDCDEGRDDVYRGAEEVCDGADNDCDGEIDNGFDFESDHAHCGACDNQCGDFEVCVNRQCLCGERGGQCSGERVCNNDGLCCFENRCSSPTVIVSGGPFMMGCNEPVDNHCFDNERPYHEVNVPEFEIDITEVTMEQYRACVNSGSCSIPSTYSEYCNWSYSDREDHPVSCIDWYQAKLYCEWSGKRLCSESEWEKAARGTDGRIYPWGNQEATCARAVMKFNGTGCGEDRTWPVGSKPAGVYGLYDMAGNVDEWVEDDWHSSYSSNEGAPTDGSAWIGNPREPERIERGGGIFSDSTFLVRTSFRFNVSPSGGIGVLGIRCCHNAQ